MQSRRRKLLLFLPVLVAVAVWLLWPREQGTPQPQGPVDLSEVITKVPTSVAPAGATADGAVQAMLELAEVGPDDFLIDLGSGDGRIPIAAARQRGARALGVDIDPARIRDSRRNAEAAGVSERVRFLRQDLFDTPIAEASVLTLYLTQEINEQLRSRILREMRPGARVVSNTYDMGDWRHDRSRLVDGRDILMWIVPAQVEGNWTLRQNGRSMPLELNQEYQQLTGGIMVNGRRRSIEQGLVQGERVRFVADTGSGRRLYEGQLEGGRIVPVTGERLSYPVTPASGWVAVRGRE